VASCFRLSARNSRRICWCKSKQRVELLVVHLGPAAHAGFGDFLEPCSAMARRIHLLTGTGDGPASVERFQTNITRVRSLVIVI
jgi:hypothetical protein